MELGCLFAPTVRTPEHIALAETLDLGVVGDTAECAAFGKEVAEVAEDRRHLELHRAHLLDLTELDRPFVTGELVATPAASRANSGPMRTRPVGETLATRPGHLTRVCQASTIPRFSPVPVPSPYDDLDRDRYGTRHDGESG